MEFGEPLEDFNPKIRWPFTGILCGSTNTGVGWFGWLVGWLVRLVGRSVGRVVILF